MRKKTGFFSFWNGSLILNEWNWGKSRRWWRWEMPCMVHQAFSSSSSSLSLFVPGENSSSVRQERRLNFIQNLENLVFHQRRTKYHQVLIIILFLYDSQQQIHYVIISCLILELLEFHGYTYFTPYYHYNCPVASSVSSSVAYFYYYYGLSVPDDVDQDDGYFTRTSPVLSASLPVYLALSFSSLYFRTFVGSSSSSFSPTSAAVTIITATTPTTNIIIIFFNNILISFFINPGTNVFFKLLAVVVVPPLDFLLFNQLSPLSYHWQPYKYRNRQHNNNHLHHHQQQQQQHSFRLVCGSWKTSFFSSLLSSSVTVRSKKHKNQLIHFVCTWKLITS